MSITCLRAHTHQCAYIHMSLSRAPRPSPSGGPEAVQMLVDGVVRVFAAPFQRVLDGAARCRYCEVRRASVPVA